jgi:RecB family exonuclease
MTFQLPLEAASLFPDLRQRGSVYVWVTWAASYLAGDTNCEWSVWVRARYQGWKMLDEAEGNQMALWHVNHTALLRQLVAAARANGERVWVEGQNAFRLVATSNATLAGKPDLVTLSGDGTITVIDAKTGQRKPAHTIQVMLYQWALAQSNARFRGRAIAGRVVYADGGPPVLIPPGAINAAFEQRVLECLAQLAAPTPPYRLPSRQECRFCPVSRQVCPERVEWDVEEECDRSS